MTRPVRASYAAAFLTSMMLACGGGDDASPVDQPFVPSPAPREGTDLPGPSSASSPPSDTGAAAAKTIEVHLVFVNGLEDPDHYATGDGDTAAIANAVLADFAKKAPAFETAHHVKLAVTKHRLNVYTNVDGTVPNPGTDDGTGAEVAQKWRSQLAKKLAALFPNGEKNIVLLGHSTGARVSMEVAADVGGANIVLGAGTWGFSDRIAGVVSFHGMLDALGKYPTSPKVVSFELGCKVAKKSGWCEYAANVSAWPAADWVAKNRRSLVLTSANDDCGFPLWAEDSDNALPLRAQGSPASVGLALSKLSSGQYGVAHGIVYGSFCHSDPTNGKSVPGKQSIAAATAAISRWLFESAPITVNPEADDQIMASPVISAGTLSIARPLEAPCPTSWVSSKSTPLALVGNCSHPGLSDGDDHPMAAAQLFLAPNGACGGTVQWKNTHADAHAGTVWFKAYAEPAKDPSLLGSLLSP